MSENRLMEAFRALGEAVEAEGVAPVAAVAIRSHRSPLLWMYLPADAEPDQRRAYLDEIHRRLSELLEQVEAVRRT